MLTLLLLTNVAATLAMAGLIWFVQIVHYPLFATVGRQNSREYESLHQQRTTWVVAPLMITEAATGLLLLVTRPDGVDFPTAAIAMGLVGVVWGSTFFWQVPLHGKLSVTFDPNVHRLLVRSNWLRTMAWTVRGVLVLWMCWTAMS